MKHRLTILLSHEFQRGKPEWPRVRPGPYSEGEGEGTDSYLTESTYHPHKVIPLNR